MVSAIVEIKYGLLPKTEGHALVTGKTATQQVVFRQSSVQHNSHHLQNLLAFEKSQAPCERVVPFFFFVTVSTTFRDWSSVSVGLQCKGMYFWSYWRDRIPELFCKTEPGCWVPKDKKSY